MRRKIRWAAVSAATMAIFGVTVNATPIYRQVDADGRITFTDTPVVGAERLAQGGGNTYRAPPKQQSIAEVTEPAQTQSTSFVGYDSVTIDWPQEEAIRANNGTIRIVATTQPELQQGHHATLLVNGQVVQQRDDLTFNLTEMDRGTHEVAVRISSSSGQALAESRPKIIHILRASRQTALK